MPAPSLFWHLLTRMGEMQIVLPAALLACLPLWREVTHRSLVRRWSLTLLLSITLTTVTKLAFIGWGVGIGVLNFTGISGHAMFATAVYPVLAVLMTSHGPHGAQRLAALAGIVLAWGVGLSRIVVGAHSVSEVIAGLVVGGAVSWVVLRHRPWPRIARGPWMPLLVLVWLVVTPLESPQLHTHSAVTRLSLLLAGHDTPYTRAEMLRRLQGKS